MTMKWMILSVFTLSVLNAGFFNEDQESEKAQRLENERLCKLFTKKIEDYKKTMRDDILAKTTLASYEHRASLFCARAKPQNDENASN